MELIRGEKVGRGSFATVSKATIKSNSSSDIYSHLPSVIALKTCHDHVSDSLKTEKLFLDRIGNTCPHIIRCYGDAVTLENGQRLYSLILEFAPGGNLHHEIKTRGNGSGLPENEIRQHTRAVLEGLCVIHSKGFTHCDIKPENILLFEDGEVKIADFGLAKENGVKSPGMKLRGTPPYMSPESVKLNYYGPPCDVWALGCVVVEMATGKLAWRSVSCWNTKALLKRIASDDELPEIPPEMSEEGRNFVKKCLVKDPKKRWTAKMLLNHPFVVDGQEGLVWRLIKSVLGCQFCRINCLPQYLG